MLREQTARKPSTILGTYWGPSLRHKLRTRTQAAPGADANNVRTGLRTGADVEIRQAVRVPRGEPLDVKIGQRAEIVCWGVMPSGMLRHPVVLDAA